MKFDPASRLQDLLQFGEYGDVNPSVTDSATFTFLEARTMKETFDGTSEGCYLYSRHWNPSNKYLADALAAMENTESAWVTGSGMSAITAVILQLVGCGDHIICNRSVYGGTFAFMNNWLKKISVQVTFVDATNLEEVEAAVRPNTRLIYTETMTNPMLQISDLPELARIANKHNIKLVVDNTFTPMMVTPSNHGAHITVYSMTKFINGKNDCVAGSICGSHEFINALCDVNSGTAMLLGPVLDPLRSSNILKNLHTLHIRMRQHCSNALYLAERLSSLGVDVNYPGLSKHPGHETLKRIMNHGFGFGGLLTIDMKTSDRASILMEAMQKEGVGYLAVSLGYFKTLFSNSGKSTSSEVPENEQQKMGLSEGLVRISVGLDNDIERSFEKIQYCLETNKLLS